MHRRVNKQIKIGSKLMELQKTYKRKSIRQDKV